MRTFLIMAAVAAVFAVALLAGVGSAEANQLGFEITTAMAVVQSAYSERQAVAFAGQPGTMVPYNIDTRNCETAAGIGFGVACGQGAATKGAVLGGTLATFVGVSVRDITLVASGGGTVDEYAENENMGLLTMGDIWVAPSVAVAITDPVHYDATTGVFAISGGSGPIVGARWMTPAGSGELALLRLTGNLPVP